MANTKLETEELQALRKKIFITGYKGGMAHLASCYSCLEMLYALYLKDILRYDLFYPQLGVKTLLDGGRRRTKNLYGVFKRTVPAGQVRQ